MMLVATYVHTEGINWASVAAIAAVVGVIVSVLLWIFARWNRRREIEAAGLRQEMKDGLEHLATVMEAKLATQQAVAHISERLARVEAKIDPVAPG
jgi:sensor domain CHASE-containing protein